MKSLLYASAIGEPVCDECHRNVKVPPRIPVRTQSRTGPSTTWAMTRPSLVEQRDRGVPFDGVPDRRRKLLDLLVRLHIRVSAAAMVHADDRCV